VLSLSGVNRRAFQFTHSKGASLRRWPQSLPPQNPPLRTLGAGKMLVQTVCYLVLENPSTPFDPSVSDRLRRPRTLSTATGTFLPLGIYPFPGHLVAYPQSLFHRLVSKRFPIKTNHPNLLFFDRGFPLSGTGIPKVKRFHVGLFFGSPPGLSPLVFPDS